MTVPAVWNTIRFHWVILVAAIVIGVSAGFGLTALSSPLYTARADVFVAVSGAQDPAQIAQGADYSQEQARNFAAVATRELVLQPVIDDLNLETSVAGLRSHILTSVQLNTSIITISVTDAAPKRAAAIANSVAQNLSGSVAVLVPATVNGQRESVSIQSLEQAVPPSAPSSPNTTFNVILGLLAGLVVGVVLAAARETFSAKVRSAQHAAELTAAPVIGTISPARSRGPHVVDSLDPGSARSEEYRRLRTNLRFLQTDRHHKVFVLTSSIEGEAKSSTAANIAATIAASGRSVCLVEADLRQPTLAALLKLDPQRGLTAVLAGDTDLDSAYQTWGTDGLHVLTSGAIPPNPSELLGSTNAETVLLRIQDRFDVTIVDCPPLIPVTDAAILARLFGGIVMIVSERKVEVREVRRALERVALVDVPVLGVILTGSRGTRSGRDYGRADAAASTPATTASSTS